MRPAAPEEKPRGVRNRAALASAVRTLENLRLRALADLRERR
jgi:hypothetical protein